MKIFTVLILFALLFPKIAYSQEEDRWNNQIYMGNKVAGGKDQLKYSGKIQIRLKDNMQQLDRWYIEGVGSYLLNKHFEITPDFQFNIKPDETEKRPGLGILYNLERC